MKFVLEKIVGVLSEIGVGLEYVVWIRMFVMDIVNWELIGKVYGEFFRDIKLVVMMVEVLGLILREYFVEIEVDVIVE